MRNVKGSQNASPLHSRHRRSDFPRLPHALHCIWGFMNIFHSEGKGMSEGEDLFVMCHPHCSVTQRPPSIRELVMNLPAQGKMSPNRKSLCINSTFILEPILDAKMTPERRHASRHAETGLPLHIPAVPSAAEPAGMCSTHKGQTPCVRMQSLAGPGCQVCLWHRV